MEQDTHTIPLLERQYGGGWEGPYRGLKPIRIFNCKPEEIPFRLLEGQRYSINIFDQIRMTNGIYYEDIPTDEEIANFVKLCNEAIEAKKDLVYICSRTLKHENGEASGYSKEWYLLNCEKDNEYDILFKISTQFPNLSGF